MAYMYFKTTQCLTMIFKLFQIENMIVTKTYLSRVMKNNYNPEA